MNFNSCFYLFLCSLALFANIPAGYSQKLDKKAFVKGIKKVEKIPYLCEFPLSPLPAKTGRTSEKAWIVYSDRQNNSTFADENLSSSLQKVALWDAFYVVNETKELVELIKYDPELLFKNTTTIKDPNKLEYVGWMEKSKLLLSEKSTLDLYNRRPLKSLTILNGTSLLDKIKNYADGEEIRVFDNPEGTLASDKRVNMNEIVYVYKKVKDMVLLGSKPNFQQQNSRDLLFGWVHTSFVQAWGQRLCIEVPEKLAASTKPVLLYSTKEQAISGTSPTGGYPLSEIGCSQPENMKKRSPALKTETVTNGNLSYKAIQTLALETVIDKRKSFIYNVNGNKIPYTKLCELEEGNKNINLVFAIQSGSDTKEYLNSFISTLQQLTDFFLHQKKEYAIRFGATDCSVIFTTNSIKIPLTANYSDLLPNLIAMSRLSVENKNGSPSTSIVNGLNNALKLFKGHENESNVVILFSSQADNALTETNTKQLRESVLNEMAESQVRVLFAQPYCGNSAPYATFVSQAKGYLKNVAEKSALAKRELLVSNEKETTNLNEFRTIQAGEKNIYCLDYPVNASYQGFLVFPTVGNMIDHVAISQSLDSLFEQMELSNKKILQSMRQMFNSTSSFNNSLGSSFQRYYATQEAVPSDLAYHMKNVEYTYSIPGYVTYPVGASYSKPIKHSLILSESEYEELYAAFKSLQLDAVSPSYDTKSRTTCYVNMMSLLQKYGDERMVDIPEYSTLSKFFHVLEGLWTETKSLNQYKVTDIKSTSLSKDNVKSLFDHLNSRLSLFYTLRNNNSYLFTSYGTTYYWVGEEFLP
jgi:hypothetical protein